MSERGRNRTTRKEDGGREGLHSTPSKRERGVTDMARKPCNGGTEIKVVCL